MLELSATKVVLKYFCPLIKTSVSNSFNALACAPKIAGFRYLLPPAWGSVNPNIEPNPNAFELRGDKLYYYGKRLSRFDNTNREVAPDEVKLTDDNVGTTRPYDIYLRRLGLTNEWVLSQSGRSVISVGEGNSDFTFEMLKRGWDAWAVDSEVLNPFAPVIIASKPRFFNPDIAFHKPPPKPTSVY